MSSIGWVKWAFLGSFVGGAALLYWVSDNSHFSSLGAALAVMIAGWSLLALSPVLWVLWFALTWRCLHEGYRMTASGQPLPMSGLLLMLLVPGYNLYGIFVVTAAVTHAFSAEDSSSVIVSTKTMGIVAAIVTVLPFFSCVLPAPGVWFRYMLRIDRARAASSLGY